MSQQGTSQGAEAELADLLAGLGIDPASLAGGGQPVDPYAIFGSQGPALTDRVGVRTRPRPARPGPPIGARGDERARLPGGNQLVTQSVGEVLQRFYQLDPSVLRDMQALLYAGGFYGDMDVTDVAWGQADEESFAAWATAVGRTARKNAAGEDVTWEQVIYDAASAAGIDLGDIAEAVTNKGEAGLEALLRATTGRVLEVELSDPNRLRATMDQVAGAVLGRKANAAEQRMFIGLIHGVQRGQQLARQTAEPLDPVRADAATAAGFGDEVIGPNDVVTEFAQPDEGATAEALIRQQNPAEAGAHDIAVQFANFLDLLPAPVDVPRLTL